MWSVVEIRMQGSGRNVLVEQMKVESRREEKQQVYLHNLIEKQ